MFTSEGDWAFYQAHDSICDRLGPQERTVYLELRRQCVRQGTRTVTYSGRPVVLIRNQIHVRLRDLAAWCGLAYGTFYRAWRNLTFGTYVRVLESTRGPGGGLLCYVADPDDISDLRASRVRRVDQLRRKLLAEKDWEKSPEKKARRIKLDQLLDHLRRKASQQVQRTFGYLQPVTGSTVGSIQLEIPITTNAETLDQCGSSDRAGASKGPQNGDSRDPLFAIRKVPDRIYTESNISDKLPESQGDSMWQNWNYEEVRTLFFTHFPTEDLRRKKCREMMRKYPGEAWRRVAPKDGSKTREALAKQPPNLESYENRITAIWVWFRNECAGFEPRESPEGPPGGKAQGAPGPSRTGDRIIDGGLG